MINDEDKTDNEQFRIQRGIKGVFLFATLSGIALGLAPLLGRNDTGIVGIWVFFPLISIGLIRYFAKYGPFDYVPKALSLLLIEVICLWMGIVKESLN